MDKIALEVDFAFLYLLICIFHIFFSKVKMKMFYKNNGSVITVLLRWRRISGCVCSGLPCGDQGCLLLPASLFNESTWGWRRTLCPWPWNGERCVLAVFPYVAGWPWGSSFASLGLSFRCPPRWPSEGELCDVMSLCPWLWPPLLVFQQPLLVPCRAFMGPGVLTGPWV